MQLPYFQACNNTDFPVWAITLINMTPPVPTPQDSYRADIDGLRAIAILAVLVYHAFPSLAKGGFVGVDVFFVISGFLISRIVFRGVEQGNFSFASFYAHRVKRIFPALILVLVACFGAGWLVLLPDEFSQLGKHMVASVGFVQNIMLWKEVGYFNVASDLKPLLHLWSLAIEEQFYLVYPLLIWLAWRAGLNVLTLVVALAALSFAFNVGRIGAHPVDVFFLAQTRFWELLAGSGLAYLGLFKLAAVRTFLRRVAFHPVIFRRAPAEAEQDIAVNNALATLGLGMIVAAVFGVSRAYAFPGWWAAVPVTGSWLLIYAGPHTWVNRTVLANRFMVFVGLISYPLYLWHWPLLSFLRIIELSPTRAQRLAALVLAFLLAWLTYRLIERPVRFGAHGRAKVWALAVLLVSVGFAGLLAYKGRGLPSRFPAEIRGVAAYEYDFKTDARAGKCWLGNDDSPDAFAPTCWGKLKTPAARSTVAIWGDSHAARLYPGLEQLSPGVAQLTRDSCPPTVDYGYPNCVRGNKAVIAALHEFKPDTVVLFGVWNSYDQRWTKDRASAAGLLASIEQLKAAGITNILVVGPAPNWVKNLPKLAFKVWLRDHKIPTRMKEGLEPTAAAVDADLKELLKGYSGVRYFSAMDALCNADGCMVRTTDDPASFTTWDYGHLTTSAAVIVAEKMRAGGLLRSP